MTNLEEAREQARKALHEYQGALAAFAPTRLVRAAWFMSETLTSLLDATEPPAQAEPAEDEREALVKVIRLFFQNWRAIGRVSPSLEMSIDSLEGAVDDLIELDAPRDGDYHEGFEEGVKVGRAGSGACPITDEMVKEARLAWHAADATTGPGTRMRAALEAAEGARR